jgi:hypothetical protein
MSNRKQVGEGRPDAAGAGWRAIACKLRHCLLASALACVATAAPAADPSQYTEAERQLFVRPHLAEVAAPTRLHYHYERTGTLQPEATDHATLTLGGQGGGRTAAVDYLSGDRRLELPTIDYVEQNPIILHFLEREVRQLKELTGGAITFYRNRIRKALAGEPKVRETEFEYGGRKVKGVEIRIDPYLDDPARSRFEKFVDRYYVMVLSPEIPGEVYQLRAELPAPAGSKEGGVVHREVLTFDREERGG